MSRTRKRSWWRRRQSRRGWSKTSLLRLRIHHGATIAAEPALVVLYPKLPAWSAPPFIRIQVPHAGVELAIASANLGHVFRRRVTVAPRSSRGLRAAAVAWQIMLGDGGHVKVSEPFVQANRSWTEDLEATMCRALVLELLGRVGRVRLVGKQMHAQAR